MNNYLKSLLISFCPLYVVVMTVLAASEMYLDFDTVWLGVMLGHALIGLFFFLGIVLQDQARSRPLLPRVSVLTLPRAVLTLMSLANGNHIETLLVGARHGADRDQTGDVVQVAQNVVLM